MENYYKIKNLGGLKERQFLDRNGNQQTFVSKGFKLTNGIDTIYAEAVGDYARSLGELDETALHRVQMQNYVREYTDKEGITRYNNEVRIVKIV